MDSRKSQSRTSSQKSGSTSAKSMTKIESAKSARSPSPARSDDSILSQEYVADFNMRYDSELDTEDDNDSDYNDAGEDANKEKMSPDQKTIGRGSESVPDLNTAVVEPPETESVAEQEPNVKEMEEGQEGEPMAGSEQRSTEEEEEVDAPVKGKKTARKPKRKVEKRTAFDGRDVVFVTECTQTDWRWRDNVEKMGRGKLITPRSVKPESREAVSRTHTEGESTMDTRTATDVTPFSLQPNDEFGIPLLDMSSDSDSSDDDGPKKSKTHRHHLPTIGPPQILKYVRESDKQDKDTDRTSSELDDDRHLMESTDYMSSPGMFGGTCEFCANDIKPFPSLEQQLSLPPEQLYCCDEYREFVEFAMTTANKLEEDVAKKNEKISIKVHPHHGSKQARKMAKEQAVLRMREREMARRQQEATGMQAAYFNLARQMKTINYQLSSQRCLEEGWTLRAPSPLDMDDLDAEVFIPEPLHPAMIASGKLHDRKLIEKFYPDGSKFLTMFPDGTGNVFYPSGNLAIAILSISLGQYTYVLYDDGPEPELLAVFGPNGIGCCHFANGKIRLNYDQFEGIELDIAGGKKRVWSWRDQETHVHAPPFQPIVFGMNRYVGVRFMAQESIALTLTGRKRSCRFNVGAKLKLISPENVQPKAIDENQLFIDERKVRVDTILDRVSTLLKFPKSPKVDRILPPLSIKSRQEKVDRLKKDHLSASQLANATGKKQKKVPKQTRLSPLPVISVN